MVLAIEDCSDFLKDNYHHQQYFCDHCHRHLNDPDRDCRLKEPIMGYVWLLAVGEGQVCCERQGPSSLIDYPATNGPGAPQKESTVRSKPFNTWQLSLFKKRSARATENMKDKSKAVLK